MTSPNHQQTHYERLGVPHSADAKTIRKAYMDRARQLHPDKKKAASNRSDAFLSLQTAWEILQDPQLRQEYDQSLQRRHSQITKRLQNAILITTDEAQAIVNNDDELDWKFTCRCGTVLWASMSSDETNDMMDCAHCSLSYNTRLLWQEGDVPV